MDSRSDISEVKVFKDRKGIKHVNQYTLHEKLGQGGLAKVRLVRDSNQPYVISY